MLAYDRLSYTQPCICYANSTSPSSHLVVELHEQLQTQAGWSPAYQWLRISQLWNNLGNESDKDNLPEASYDPDSQVLATVSTQGCCSTEPNDIFSSAYDIYR